VLPVRYGQTYRFEIEIKYRTMDNVQNCDSNVPSSQTSRSYSLTSVCCHTKRVADGDEFA
jgi:hypothetical protein